MSWSGNRRGRSSSVEQMCARGNCSRDGGTGGMTYSRHELGTVHPIQFDNERSVRRNTNQLVAHSTFFYVDGRGQFFRMVVWIKKKTLRSGRLLLESINLFVVMIMVTICKYGYVGELDLVS